MSCKEYWEQQLAGPLASATRVAPAQVDGAQYCDHAGCKALVIRSTNTCVAGHRQGDAAIEALAPRLVDGLVCLCNEMDEDGAGLETDDRVIFARYMQARQQGIAPDQCWVARFSGPGRPESRRNYVGMPRGEAEAMAYSHWRGYFDEGEAAWDVEPMAPYLQGALGIDALEGTDQELADRAVRGLVEALGDADRHWGETEDPRFKVGQAYATGQAAVSPSYVQKALAGITNQGSWLRKDLDAHAQQTGWREKLARQALGLWGDCDSLERNFGREMTAADRAELQLTRETALAALEPYSRPQLAATLADFYDWGEEGARALQRIPGWAAQTPVQILAQATTLADRVSAGLFARRELDWMEERCSPNLPGDYADRLNPQAVERLLDVGRSLELAWSGTGATEEDGFVLRAVDDLTEYRRKARGPGTFTASNRLLHMRQQRLDAWKMVQYSTSATPTKWLREKAAALGLAPVLAANASRAELSDWLLGSATEEGCENDAAIIAHRLWDRRRAVVAPDRTGRERRFRAGDVVEVSTPRGPVRYVVAGAFIEHPEAEAEGAEPTYRAVLVMQVGDTPAGQPTLFPASEVKFLSHPKKEETHEL